MRHTQKLLMSVMCIAIAAALAVVALFETDVLPCGYLSGSGGSGEFVAAMTMELLTLCVIPVALRLFRFARIAAAVAGGGPEALARWGVVRLLMLCVPLLANTLLYYMYMNVAFGYMGIILLLCLAFVAPTKTRCENEAKCDEGIGNNSQL